ncbi:hypothetical protein [Roseibium aggregatum]|uniref:hypothetical protein n=1 Tax=Roseibium aggregatum TaxID=187304 RepID=UPI001AD91485|nr:hypothetical protein [Roseibium aggregatum]
MNARHPNILNSVLFAACCLTTFSASAQDTDCVVYATDYANARMGSGDVVGDAVSGGMTGAVAGGAWAGPGGAIRGARAGGALGVLDNLGSMPGGWQALYDTAYQMCQQQSANAGVAPAYGSPHYPNSDCRSSATVTETLNGAPKNSFGVGSSFGTCR